jgi:hypothetical protein
MQAVRKLRRIIGVTLVMACLTSLLWSAPAQAITAEQSHQRYLDIVYVESNAQNWVYSLAKKIQSNCCPTDPAVMSYGYLVWDTDGCSWAPDKTFYYDFRAPCTVHDFSYRNWKRLEYLRRTYSLPNPDVWNETRRQQIDDHFLFNMLAKCEAQPWYYRDLCKKTAKTFYNTVRLFGS